MRIKCDYCNKEKMICFFLYGSTKNNKTIFINFEEKLCLKHYYFVFKKHLLRDINLINYRCFVEIIGVCYDYDRLSLKKIIKILVKYRLFQFWNKLRHPHQKSLKELWKEYYEGKYLDISWYKQVENYLDKILK